MKKSAQKTKQVKHAKVAHHAPKCCGVMGEHSMFVIAGALFVMLGYLYVSKTDLFGFSADLPMFIQTLLLP